MNSLKTILILMGIVILTVVSYSWVYADALSPEEILTKVDQNHDYQTAYSESHMEITVGRRKVTKRMRAWNEGKDKAFVEFIDKRDQSRILKIKNDLWLFSPTAETELKLSGDMLKQGMAGSDFSYQDALEAQRFKDLYQAERIGEEIIDERPCFVLELTAKENVEVSYYRRKMWIDKKRFVGIKEELYAPSGKLLKVSRAEKVEQFGERFYPTVVVMSDKLRKNSSTRFVIEKMQFDLDLPSGTFSRQNLTARQ